MNRQRPETGAGSRRRRLAASAVLALAALTAGACGSDDPGAAPNTTEAKAEPTTTAAPTGTTVEVGSMQDKRNVIDTLSAFWAERLKALNPPDPNRAELLALVEGEPRNNVLRTIADFQSKGWTARRDESKPSKQTTGFLSLDQQRAVVVHCMVDDGITYDATGNAVNSKVKTNEFQATLERRAGRWVIVELITQQSTVGEGCTTAAP